MQPLLQACPTHHSPESLVTRLRGLSGVMLLRGAPAGDTPSRYSLVVAQPFLTFRSYGARCVVRSAERPRTQFGNPWRSLGELLARYELLDAIDWPFPLGGCFGYWGYDLKNFLEPRLRARAVHDLGLPDCHLGFYASLVVFDHRLDQTWIVATGLAPDGARAESRARRQAAAWQEHLESEPAANGGASAEPVVYSSRPRGPSGALPARATGVAQGPASTLDRAGFIAAVCRAQEYIRAGDIYQVCLSHRLAVPSRRTGWDLYRALTRISPAPFSAYINAGGFQIVSASPELFLRLSGAQVVTRPIKGTRPRGPDPESDTRLAYELQTSPKEMAELVMITDLLRNDLGRVCEYGSVQVTDLARLERFSQVQHLVSTVEGRLRPGLTHAEALAACFPGGSVTGAPKVRAMEIIDELEPVARGPYTGALGYLGFNGESQVSMIIRTALRAPHWTYFHVGAGIVADSVPAAEYVETLDKAAGFLAALPAPPPTVWPTAAGHADRARRRRGRSPGAGRPSPQPRGAGKPPAPPL